MSGDAGRKAEELPRIRSGDREIAYREWPGPGDRPPLVLVHGFLVDHREWEDVAVRLASRRRVVALDLPGFGRSPTPPKGVEPSFELFVEAVIGLIDELALGTVDLAGHSMGGGIAVALAARHPGRVRKLVPVDALSFPFPLPFKGRLPLIPGFGPLLFKRLYGRGMFVNYFRKDVVHDPRTLNVERIEHYYRAFDTRERRDWAYRTLRLTAHPSPVAKAAPAVHAPTLIVWGEHDRLIPLRVAHQLRDAIPGARLELVAGSGHAAPEEQPEATAQLMAGFLD